jgi:hypothetical protein
MVFSYSFACHLSPYMLSSEMFTSHSRQTKETLSGSLKYRHGRMARGGHGLPKVSLGPAMPYPSTPCGWPTYRAGGLRLTSDFYPFGHPTPYAYAIQKGKRC